MHLREAVFKDCQYMRQESWQSMKNRNSILTFGLATLGVVFLGAINAYTKAFDNAGMASDALLFSYIVITFGIPVLSILILILWLGEAQRMNRLGVYVAMREELINAYFSKEIKDALSLTNKEIPKHFIKVAYWENYIREESVGILKGGGILSNTRQLIFPYAAVVILFLSIAFFSALVGIRLILNDLPADSFLRQNEFLSYLPLAFALLSAIYIYKVYKVMEFEWEEGKKQIEMGKSIDVKCTGVNLV